MFSRRQVLLRSASYSGILAVLGSGQPVIAKLLRKTKPAEEHRGKWVLWYDKPATSWTERLPLGNGQFGAMLDGAPDYEKLQLNHDTFWAGGPYSPSRPGAYKHLGEVQNLLLNNQPLEAQAILEEHMMAMPSRQMPYQSLGELTFKFDGLAETASFSRSLDLETAIARSRYETAEGVGEWSTFISAPANVMVRRFRATGRAVRRLLIGYHRAAGVQIEASPNGTMIVSGVNRSAYGVDGVLRFCLHLLVNAPGATFEPVAEGLWVIGGPTIEIVAATATNFVNYKDVSADPEAVTSDLVKSAMAKGVDALEAEHVAEHQRYFRSFDIDLGDTDRSLWPTDKRVAANNLERDPQLAALMAQYGRYLLIASSRPGCQPSTLQGLWNADDDPIWGSKYTININTQMNYWAAEQVGLQACVEPLVQMVRDLAETGKKTAADHWDAKGWVAHHNTDLWRATAPIDRARSGYWPTGGAWLTLHLFERYRYNRDETYLASIWPILKGAAEFFLTSMVVDPATGYLVTAPSISPENKTPFGTALCYGPMMDTEIIRDLYRCTIEATETLGIESEFRDQLTKNIAKLSPLKIGNAGQLQEWPQNWDLQVPEQHHRHISHLYALYPSRQIHPVETPDLAKAAKRTLELRGDGKSEASGTSGMGDFAVRYGASLANDQDTTGWGLAWRACLRARLHDGAGAYESLAKLFSTRRLCPNLFTLHPPFQIDGNFGAVAAIVEILVQQHNGRFDLLPALPAQWQSGWVSGLRLQGEIALDMSWSKGVVTSVRMQSPINQQVLIIQRNRSVVVSLQAKKPVTFRQSKGAQWLEQYNS